MVGHIIKEIHPSMRMQYSAVGALYVASDAYLTRIFEDANLCAIRDQRIKVTEEDMRAVPH